ncbi:MAG: sodium:solute symporter, partial [Planctomycetota bacterium]
GGNILFLQLTLGYILGRLLVVALFLPLYFRGELFTAYEVLDRRFGGATKQTASLLFLVTRNVGDGLRLFLAAIVLQKVLGLDLVSAIVVIGLTTILYTVVGGMRSVVWNDCIQFVIYMLGALLALGVIVEHLPGGWGQLIAFGQSHGKFQVIDLSVDPTRPYTLWSGLLGGVFIAMATHGTDQLMVQRYLAAGNERRAAWALGTSGVVVCGQFAIFLLVGVALACFYQVYPPEVAFARSDAVFARFIVENLPVGITGVTLAAVFAAAMSTLSSSLNASATAAINDLYLPRLAEKPSPARLVWLSRWLTVAFGLAQVGVAIAGRQLEENVINSVMAIAGFTTGPILGVFFLGLVPRSVSQRGALFGLVGGLAVLSGVAFGTRLAWPWYAIVGASVTFGMGIVANALLPVSAGEPSDADDQFEREPRESERP